MTTPLAASTPPAVILAAGDGGRLFEHTYSTPKPLIEAGGRPLVSYTLDALAEACVREAIVVTGYRADQLQRGVEDWLPEGMSLRFVRNADFEGGASFSLRAARAACGTRPFLLVMADHMLGAAIPAGLLSAARRAGPSLVAIDASPWPEEYTAEATKVRLRAGTRAVAAIGKSIAPWDGLDTGAFLLAPEVWDAVDLAPKDCELSTIFTLLAGAGRLHAADVSGARWYDVDTPSDLEAARLLVAGEPAA